MKPEQFICWLQGYFEITSKPNEGLTAQQCGVIKEHLKKVFNQPPVVPTQYPAWFTNPGEIQPTKIEETSPLISWNSTDHPVS